MSSKYSGLQHDVFKLYRVLIRAARLKDSSKTLHNVVINRFREIAYSTSRTDFKQIEHLMRWGYKQKKLIEMPGFSLASVVQPR